MRSGFQDSRSRNFVCVNIYVSVSFYFQICKPTRKQCGRFTLIRQSMFIVKRGLGFIGSTCVFPNQYSSDNITFRDGSSQPMYMFGICVRLHACDHINVSLKGQRWAKPPAEPLLSWPPEAILCVPFWERVTRQPWHYNSVTERKRGRNTCCISKKKAWQASLQGN